MNPQLRRILWTAAATVGALALSCAVAVAKYRGSDVLGNLAPRSLLGGGSLADRHPLAAYGLDSHVDVGVTDLDGVPPTIAQWAAAQLWSLTSFLVRTVIDVFSWAFSLDLLGGSPDRSDDGAIVPVAAAISSLYENVIGEAWLAAAVTAAGMWGIWKALVQRRYSQTAAALGMSVVFVLVALFFVFQPERTVGQASKWANDLSVALLSGTNRGTVDDPAAAKRTVADQLFAAGVVQPWLALEFGGVRHCVDTDRLDGDGFPRPVSEHDPARDVCRDHVHQRGGYGGYAPRFLRHPVGSDERDAEYEALKNGAAPAGDPAFNGYRVDKADAPAVDIQQAGGAFQRLTLAIVVFCGSLGMVCLLGFLSLAVVLAQIVALVLLAFAPVALVVGVFPGAGHDLFRGWLARLGAAVFIKALYSLVIAVVVAVAAALDRAAGGLGFLLAFGLQAVFYWAIFLYRRQITQRLMAATSGGRGYDDQPVRALAQRGADVAAHPIGALAGYSWRQVKGSLRQESALSHSNEPTAPAGAPGNGDDPPPPARPPGPTGDRPPRSPRPSGSPAYRCEPDTGQSGATAAPVHLNGHARSEHPPAFNGQGAAATPPQPASRVSPGRERSARRPELEQSLGAPAQEDVMRRARELREQHNQALGDTDEEQLP